MLYSLPQSVTEEREISMMTDHNETVPLLQPVVSQGKDHLRALPAEIRLLIYEDLIPCYDGAPWLKYNVIKPRTWTSYKPWTSNSRPHYATHVHSGITNLAQTRHQFEEEALELMYRKCTFTISIGSRKILRPEKYSSIVLDASRIRYLDLEILPSLKLTSPKYYHDIDLINFWIDVDSGQNLEHLLVMLDWNTTVDNEETVITFLRSAWERVENPFRITATSKPTKSPELWKYREPSMNRMLAKIQGSLFYTSS